MSLALAAELNGYPGPAHVLELGDALGLSASQKIQVTELRRRMTVEARDVGERIIGHEQTLDRLFASRTANPENIAATTTAIALLQGELRHVHLKYHLDTYALLSPSQNDSYQKLRGYPGAAPSHRQHH
jgi:Spy/CpxP family protein refolding chaperone